MYIAISKRRENIAEYILYLWQIEDLLRALQFSPEAVYSQLIKPRNLTPDKQEELLMWYMDIANLLREEGGESVGHLSHTMHLIGDLNNLHLQLLELPVGAEYRVLSSKLSPELPSLRALVSKSEKLKSDEITDIELCFRALYAVMLYRIKGDTKGEGAISDVLEVISPVIAELSRIFHQVEAGDVDLFTNSSKSSS